MRKLLILIPIAIAGCGGATEQRATEPMPKVASSLDAASVICERAQLGEYKLPEGTTNVQINTPEQDLSCVLPLD